MEVIGHVEYMLKDETNFEALASFYWLKLAVTGMRRNDHF